MRVCSGVAVAAVIAALSAISLGAQVEPAQRAFYAEQQKTWWYADGKRDEELVRITRLANRSFLAIHSLPAETNSVPRTGGEFFYLVDTERHIAFSGESDLGAAWPLYGLSPSLPGRDRMVDQYGDCSVLNDGSISKVNAGNVRSFSVLRIETKSGNEVYTSWIAPKLDCFPLRSQVLVDGLVRERVDTLKLDLLPGDARLSLPRGTRVISPQAYCDLYRKVKGQEYLPQRLCSKYQHVYEEVTGANDGAKAARGRDGKQ